MDQKIDPWDRAHTVYSAPKIRWKACSNLRKITFSIFCSEELFHLCDLKKNAIEEGGKKFAVVHAQDERRSHGHESPCYYVLIFWNPSLVNCEFSLNYPRSLLTKEFGKALSQLGWITLPYAPVSGNRLRTVPCYRMIDWAFGVPFSIFFFQCSWRPISVAKFAFILYWQWLLRTRIS